MGAPSSLWLDPPLRYKFTSTIPLNLVYAADLARMNDARAVEQTLLAGADAGCIAQNVYLFCAAMGLATLVRGLIDRRHLAMALGTLGMRPKKFATLFKRFLTLGQVRVIDLPDMNHMAPGLKGDR